ncbi:MAG: transposase [Chloroflexota bacterium]
MGLLDQQPNWAFGFEDESWWSRLSHPDLHSWVENGEFLKLVEQPHHKEDPDPKAIACYGLDVRWADPTQLVSEHVWLRFVEGNPRSKLTISYLEWLETQLQAAGKRVLVMFWDHASWHISKMVRSWVRTHNREVKKTGQGVRFLVCLLPKKSPWLNPIEPMWIHAKRKVVEPDRKLSADELVNRVCAVFDQPVLPLLKISENVD